MTREDAQMKIRLPADLRDRIAAAAKEGQRTLNAEVIARLQASFDRERIPIPPMVDIALTRQSTSELAEEVARLILIEIKRPGDLPFRHGDPDPKRKR